jgi:hypothetical protein
MSGDYRIESAAGGAFKVIAPSGETVDTYPNEEAARQEIERCKREDAMWSTAKSLIDISIETLMQKYGIDRETARHWISSAIDVMD